MIQANNSKKRFYFPNQEVTLKNKACLSIAAGGQIYQKDAFGQLRTVNFLPLKRLRYAAVELLSGEVIHLAQDKKGIFCVEDLAGRLVLPCFLRRTP